MAGLKLPLRGPSGRRAVVLLAAVLAAALTARLGVWQLDRARQKTELQDRIASRGLLPPLPMAALAQDSTTAEAQHYRRITLRGRWLAERTVYLDNRQMAARQGFFVVTPLLLRDGDAVLVQRGWSPRDFNDRSRLVATPTPAGEVWLTGRIAPPPSKLFELAGAESGPIRQNLDLEAFAQETGLRLRPLSVQQTETARTVPVLMSAEPGVSSVSGEGAGPPDAGPGPALADGLLRDWPAPAIDVGKHHGYAFQWFALCALIVGLSVWFQFVRPASLPASRPPP